MASYNFRPSRDSDFGAVAFTSPPTLTSKGSVARPTSAAAAKPVPAPAPQGNIAILTVRQLLAKLGFTDEKALSAMYDAFVGPGKRFSQSKCAPFSVMMNEKVHINPSALQFFVRVSSTEAHAILTAIKPFTAVPVSVAVVPKSAIPPKPVIPGRI